MTNRKISRKQALQRMAAGSALVTAAPALFASSVEKHASKMKDQLKGNVNHSFCRWCYGNIPLEQLAEAAQEMGIKSIELLGPDEWPIVQKYGLTCAIANGSELGIPKGFNDKQYHGKLLKDFEALLPKAVDSGIKQIICFSGNRNGRSDEEGMENAAIGLEPVVKLAEKYDILITMELLNSKVNHPDYMCDHTAWGVGLAKKLGSPNFKLLYDIYHMQIMEGDIIRTIQQNQEYIAHYHTGGVPGRNEINDTQELYYPAIIKAILDTGFKGFVAQEFIPKGEDPLASLKEGVLICDL